MRVNLAHLSVVMVLSTFSLAFDASAQDGVPGPDLNNITQDVNNYDDKPLIYEHDKGNRAAVSISRDSSAHVKSAYTPAVKAKSPNGADPKKVKEEGDPLNFNFLYYIIHKFKSSDLMMEDE